MLNFFKKNQEPKEVIVKTEEKKYPDVVYEIHNEFNISGEKLLKEALCFLEEAKEKDKEKGTLLNKLGFTNTKEAKDVSELEKKENEARTNAELIQYYSLNYPNNKFITEKQVKEICEKYGLVCGDVSLYKGFVPKEKLQQISDFKLRSKDYTETTEFGTTFYTAKEFERRYGNGRGKEGILSSILSDFYNRDRNHSSIKEPFEICAPIKDMETKGYDLKGYRLEKHIPDPVVLQPVNGGYLIVCAWGDEASDEIVVNNKMN